ncbi:MAG: hypothetical protein BM557_01410 [Flavobacterium sp. MedPE-SWcel]|uniref:tyrosine-type recombinase/integrase n=1 Tax=uncultured Flavobacterium sp. TaxID=165435 RepID=UPI000912301C|nr:tyrosine-type recombinase/integrase [uncultured Flavobacterium sp.]OIQ22064.1 MAG: hypothetical protein BM557_01410 [Flavobacterium sp. MedPE-SWcel]
MTKTFNGCSFSDIWVSPKNWKTVKAKSALNDNWYIQCNFYDPAFKEKYPNGFPFRKKLNKIKTLEGRKEAIRLLLDQIPILLEKEGFNPITKIFMPTKINGSKAKLDGTMPLKDALALGIELARYEGDTKKDFRSVLKYFIESAVQLKYDYAPVNTIIGVHIDLIMDNLVRNVRKLSDKRYNKYQGYLHRLFSILKHKGIIKINPMEGYEKKKTIIQPRETLTATQRKLIQNHLSVNYPNFMLFCNVFFHSGCREVELLKVKYEDVDLINLELKVEVLKGGKPKIKILPIKKIAVPYWEKALLGAKKGDYIFSVGLVPGEQRIRRDQVTRRWREHVKKKLNITADIYSLKHSNLTEIAERRSAKDAAKAAGHTSTAMIKKHYDVGYSNREMNSVRSMTNTFAPTTNESKVTGNCLPLNDFRFNFNLK